ncbi:hypothetical protein ABLE91_14155 [Aquabacter sp. CN5-332]|uniref:hypothetical protein n=1 Tax=Aquabacter sp. CN5-332 TaxID=3156608 RepID=UPI0032B59590
MHRRSSLLPILVGAGGVVVALLAGAGVWLVLSPGGPPAQQQAAAPVPQDIVPSLQISPTVPTLPGGPAALQGPPSDEAPLPLPHVGPNVAMPSADEPARKDYARTTQENFVRNGLDLKVAATGPQATVMSIAFTFPAKTAVELIASGPFPRQCKTRGFTAIAFTDPTGASWTYDLSTDKLTQK